MLPTRFQAAVVCGTRGQQVPTLRKLRPQIEIILTPEKDTAVHPKTMFPSFLLTAALAAAAAPQPVEIARSPNP